MTGVPWPATLSACRAAAYDAARDTTGRLHEPARTTSVDVLGKVAVRVIARLSLIREPTVCPDLRRAEHLPAGVQNDAERLVVENEGETRHKGAPRCRTPGCTSNTSATGACVEHAVLQRVTGSGVGGVVSPTRSAPCPPDAPACWR